ncbi:MAG: amino acid synthesis family protein [Hyphomicrobiaceae bacterium]|nr:amino acid synthesis family protein [Hyphomicrobiaceae bacterium]
MAEIRKILLTRETALSESGQALEPAITRAVGLVVVTNPFAGRFAKDLTPLYEIGRTVGERIVGDLVAMLPRPAISYGKGAIVGVAGEVENGHACIHPMLGKPMRAGIGGGQALIPATAKVGGPGTMLDLPLGHKDDVWSFDHFDTVTVGMLDAPRPDEIVIVIGLADGGRPIPRCGKGPIR